MKTTKTRPTADRKGLVLPLVITIGVCLAFIGIGLLQVGLGCRIMAVQTTSGISARAAADAGITHALYEMNRTFVFGSGPGPLPPDLTDQALSNTYASLTYHVEGPITNSNTGQTYWLITSTGTAGRQEKTVYAMATVTNLFDYALIVTDDIVLKPYTLVDAYDSNLGYPSATDYPLKIGTNSVATWNPGQGAIDLGMGTIVEGDVLVGVTGYPADVIRGEEHAETGLQYPLSNPFDFEHILLPTIYDAAPLDLVGSTLAITAPLAYTLDNPYTVVSSRVDIAQIMTVVGHVALHVTGDMTFRQGAELYVGDPLLLGDPNWVPSSLTIYLDGNLYGNQAGGINNLSEIPANFKLLGTGPPGPPYQDWDIKNSRNFYGIYYGENADIIIRADADVFGSVSGHSYEMKNSGNLHYDVQLSNLSAYDTGFAIERWWEE